MNLKEFITKRAKRDSAVGDLCADILRLDRGGKYNWSKSDKDLLSAIEFDISRESSGGERVETAFKILKKAYEKQLVTN